MKEFISVLVDCGACLSRPHNIFGRVRNGEVKLPVVDVDIRPTLGIRT